MNEEFTHMLKLTTSNKAIEITMNEAISISKIPDNSSVTISRLGLVLQKRLIEIIPKELFSEMVEEKNQEGKVYYCHDGQKGKWLFGEFVTVESTPENMVRYDRQYYPEIDKGTLLTAKEYEMFGNLGLEAKGNLLLRKECENSGKTQGVKGFEQLGNLLK